MNREEWIDEVDLFPNEILYFEDIVSSHGRFVTTAWIPFDEFTYTELYRQIITQMQFVRNVVDSHSLNLKRSKQAANAIHISSSMQSDVHASMDMITELVNFRIRSKDYKLKRKPVTDFVDVFTIHNYNGHNIIGARDENTNKNFVLTLSDIFGIKTLISYPDQKTIRVALLGKPRQTGLAREEIEALVMAVGDGEEEEKAQTDTIRRAKDNVQVKVLQRKEPINVNVNVGGKAPENGTLASPNDTNKDKDNDNDNDSNSSVIEHADVDTPLLRMPSNIMAACNISNNEQPKIMDDRDAHHPSMYPMPPPPPLGMFNTNPFFHSMPPPGIHPHQSQLFAHIFTVTFNQIFTQSFNTAFHAAHAKTFGI